MAACLARLVLAAAAVGWARGYPTFWWTRGGGCRPPAAGDLIMGNTAVGVGVTNELALLGAEGSYAPGAQHVLKISMAPSAHLLFASKGSLSAASSGFRTPEGSLDLSCTEQTVAWISAQASRSVTWTAPAAGAGAVSFTLAAAGGYGPVTVYALSVEEGSGANSTHLIP